MGVKNEKRNNRINQIFRMVHWELLTRPLCRRLQTWPNPKFEVFNAIHIKHFNLNFLSNLYRALSRFLVPLLGAKCPVD